MSRNAKVKLEKKEAQFFTYWKLEHSIKHTVAVQSKSNQLKCVWKEVHDMGILRIFNVIATNAVCTGSLFVVVNIPFNKSPK